MIEPEASRWLIEHWTPREIPIRLHSRATGDDGAPALHPAFVRYLRDTPDDVAMVTGTCTCRHHRLPQQANPWDCPDCQGTGVYEHETLAYRYPMWRALDALQRTDRASADVVLTYVINGYDMADLATLGIDEHAVCVAISRLRARYMRAPLQRRVGWTAKSTSQQNAEMGAAAS